ncbi:TioE family transcriptional regulator [Streptomyces uncialis]|uniref:TioE family transcriptional regulator n=1 Tax=Streptomyces uncialis TaxID=1048205 RepID=UPI0038243870
MVKNSPAAGGRAHPGRALRSVDLARSAGVSTQQIRNYEDAGVLPPVPRSESGYRRFDEGHRGALLTYRALARGYGPDRARAVMRAVHADDVALALSLLDAGHAALHEQRRDMAAVGEALAAVAGEDPDHTRAGVPRGGLRIGEVAARLGVRTSALRVWEKAGLLTPVREPGTGYRWFGPEEVRDARMIRMLRQGGYRLPRIARVLDGLRRTGSAEALREAVAERGRELSLRSRAMLAGASGLHDYLAGRDGERADTGDAWDTGNAWDTDDAADTGAMTDMADTRVAAGAADTGERAAPPG